MKVAVVRVTWVPSVSPDVVVQKFKVVDSEGVVVVDKELVPSVTAEFLELSEKARVVVSLVANDGTYDSVPATLEIAVGDLVAPQPPTSLAYEVVEVKEVEVD